MGDNLQETQDIALDFGFSSHDTITRTFKDAFEMTPEEYIVCSFEAEDFERLIMDVVYKARKYLFETWLPNHKLNVRPFAAERYAHHSPDMTSMEIWVLSEVMK